MLRHVVNNALKPQRRQFNATGYQLQSIPTLSDATLKSFRAKAFNPALPVLLPGQFTQIPAIKTWFTTEPDSCFTSINRLHLDRFASTIVPLEITRKGQFARVDQPLSFFLDATASNDPDTQVYLAQAELADLPQELLQDLPVPEFVMRAGKGDVYSSSIWLGRAPTYTPLHRDPNPNLFVQLKGRKVVRLYKPHVGLSIFDAVQERIGGVGKATMRGEEMMAGAEREALEEEVWNRDGTHVGECWEADLGSGDGLFIPKGWWHSIKSLGDEGVIASVNWWFR
ncbi:related to JmjC domain protein [Ramularia collo-cygni]|uniref:Related to JmjC domain protein n=1 Tax=Ramularia collo-cygni TaxID=112498 RepID=A0A2D3V6C9_9PEZI|nr:related to JmjC domain protein [Ramularia collo-cygni]CZT17029.1 related to JmjC domain protein [Ramularia collo-cygni]